MTFPKIRKLFAGGREGKAQRVNSATTRLMYLHKIIHEAMREPRIVAPTNPAEEVDLVN